MVRRDFIQKLSLGSAGAFIGVDTVKGKNSLDFSNYKELRYHTIEKITSKKVRINFPRFVGKNAIRGNHGSCYDVTVCELVTDKGASGWNVELWKLPFQEAEKYVIGKKISDLFLPQKGLMDPNAAYFDIALHDLAGKILGIPVYKLMGADVPQVTSIYSGMIYFDDLTNYYNRPSGSDIILKECQFDYDLGYRQFKLKIGRGKKWLPTNEGIRRDIEITKLVAGAFPNCDILVDGNDGFTYEEFETYLKGIEGVKLFWIEEPFRETVEDYTKLNKLLKDMGYNALLADGEANADQAFIQTLEEMKLINVHLSDIQDIGYTGWRKLMPGLKKMDVFASPHAWGSQIKTNAVAHLAAALGNTITIEGVTCHSDEIDFGNYKIENGKLIPSTAPGFGMTLLK